MSHFERRLGARSSYTQATHEGGAVYCTVRTGSTGVETGVWFISLCGELEHTFDQRVLLADSIIITSGVSSGRMLLGLGAF